MQTTKVTQPARTPIDDGDVVRVEVLRAGTEAWGRELTRGDLQRMAENHDRLRQGSGLYCPIVLGHDSPKVLLTASNDGQPALGWVSGFEVVGDKLVASVRDMPLSLREAIQQGRFRGTSAEFVRSFEHSDWEPELGSGVKGPTVMRVAFLGGELPAVSKLEDLPMALARSAQEREALMMDSMRNDLARLFSEVDALSTHTAALLAESGARPDDLVALRQRLAELNKSIGELEGQHSAGAPGAGSMKQGSTSPDASADKHFHDVVVDDQGNGETSTAGDPPHAHRVAAGVVQPADLGNGQRSQHPGPITDKQPASAKANPNMPLGQPGRPALFPPGVPMPMGENDAALRTFAEERGLDVHDHAQRRRAVELQAENSGSVPLYGSRLQFSEEELGDLPGSRQRFDRWAQLMDKFNLDPTRARDVEKATNMLFDEIGATLRTARTYNEAERLVTRTERLNLREQPHAAGVVARCIRRARPDLVDDFGRSERQAARVDLDESVWSQVPNWFPRHMPTGKPGSPEFIDGQVYELNRLARVEMERLGLHGDVEQRRIQLAILGERSDLKPGYGVKRAPLALES